MPLPKAVPRRVPRSLRIGGDLVSHSSDVDDKKKYVCLSGRSHLLDVDICEVLRIE